MEQQKVNVEMDELLFRCLEGLANDAEYRQGWQWVHQSGLNRDHYINVRDAWIAAGLLKPVDLNRQQQNWDWLATKMQPKQAQTKMQPKQGQTKMLKYLKWTSIAAIVTLAYLLGWQTSTRQNQSETAKGEFTIEAPKGGKSLMTLIDGSKVWLNAGSSLLFDNGFGGLNRTLILHGEAYFEVAPDTLHPFLVETSGITIAALGTAFNVKAYPEDDLIETTLVEGSVRIETNAQSKTKIKPLLLEPNQKAVFHKGNESVSVNPENEASADKQPDKTVLQSFTKVDVAKNVDVEISTSWKDKRWIVRGERIGDFAPKIERKYDVVMVFEDSELKNYKISATLEEETIEQLLNAIRLTAPMDYRIERNNVYLSINRQLQKKYDRLIKNK